ncbi:MAG: ribose 5-phosphate isomerase B [Rickettsiales bacterium]|jgi:ribose 5-phosphate isomerase B|nr:ribose 5-phosphate isomerase B [Rickettsiales bacterium]
MIKIAIGNDHAGFNLKRQIVAKYKDTYEFIDCGTDSDKSVDFPVYGNKICEKVLNKGADFGVAICGTGIGISIACNRNKGIRASLCFNSLMAKLTRQHNNANVLCLGARIIGEELAFDIFETFFSTEKFIDEKYTKRNDMLDTESSY